MKKNITKTKNYREAVETAMYFMRISGAIYQARIKKGLKQKDLAQGVKTTQRIISMLENADDYNPGADLLYRIFKFLDLELVVNDKDLITGKNKYYTINIQAFPDNHETDNYFSDQHFDKNMTENKILIFNK